MPDWTNFCLRKCFDYEEESNFPWDLDRWCLTLLVVELFVGKFPNIKYLFFGLIETTFGRHRKFDTFFRFHPDFFYLYILSALSANISISYKSPVFTNNSSKIINSYHLTFLKFISFANIINAWNWTFFEKKFIWALSPLTTSVTHLISYLSGSPIKSSPLHLPTSLAPIISKRKICKSFPDNRVTIKSWDSFSDLNSMKIAVKSIMCAVKTKKYI